MTNTAHLPPLGASASQVASFLCSRVVGPGQVVTFGQYDTRLGSERPGSRRLDDPAWKMCWGGLYEESLGSDVGALVDRITLHTEEMETAGQRSMLTDRVPAFLQSLPADVGRGGHMSLLFCSKVGVRTADGAAAVRHIPMMDFRCGVSGSGLQVVITSMQRLGQRQGLVLESGQSYHYYGTQLMDEKDWHDFMYRCLLLTPFADARYIGHRLIAGTARLRITGSVTKPSVPRVVAHLVS